MHALKLYIGQSSPCTFKKASWCDLLQANCCWSSDTSASHLCCIFCSSKKLAWIVASSPTGQTLSRWCWTQSLGAESLRWICDHSFEKAGGRILGTGLLRPQTFDLRGSSLFRRCLLHCIKAWNRNMRRKRTYYFLWLESLCWCLGIFCHDSSSTGCAPKHRLSNTFTQGASLHLYAA